VYVSIAVGRARHFILTLVAVAVANILVEDSCMLAPRAEACCVHSWVARM
jgi:hypothetical protein